MDMDLDDETINALVEQGVIEEDSLDELDSMDDSLEKRLEAVEKSLQQGGRKGRATQTDGVGNDSGYSQGFVSAAKGGDQ